MILELAIFLKRGGESPLVMIELKQNLEKESCSALVDLKTLPIRTQKVPQYPKVEYNKFSSN